MSSTALAQIRTVEAPGNDMLADADLFKQMWRAAELFASSDLVPDHFKGKPANCFVTFQMARRMDDDPLLLMQNLYLVGGRPGWYTQFLIAKANASGRFATPISWEVEEIGKQPVTGDVTVKGGKRKATIDNIRVRAWAERSDGLRVQSVWITPKMAFAENWPSNAKYENMTEVMFSYRAAAFLIRMNCPEVMHGFSTAEELETMAPVQVTATAAPKDDRPARTLDAFAAEAAAEPEPEAMPDADVVIESEETKAILSKRRLADLRAMAEAKNVSWAAVEDAFGGPLEGRQLPGADAGAVEATVADTISALAKGAE